jgi:hypothetical protein
MKLATAPQLVSQPPAGPVVDELTPLRTAAQSLRNTLRLNAATSMSGGLVSAIAGGWTAKLLGTEYTGLVRLVGVGLMVFAADVAMVGGARISRLIRWAPVVCVADGLWVAATAGTIAAGWFSTSGAVLMAAVGVMVSGFGLKQLRTWLRLRRAADATLLHHDEAPPIEVAHVERKVHGSRELAWDVVTDHELYGRLAPNLSAVHVQSGTGAGMVRVCSNNAGDEWSETCTVWDEGERFEVDVRTDDYPYPLAVIRGSWWVQSEGAATSVVGMDFRYQPLPGFKGRIFAAAMQAAFPMVLRRILRGWEREIEQRSATQLNTRQHNVRKANP